MNKYAKKLYYKLFDFFQLTSFIGNDKIANSIYAALKIIEQELDIDWETISNQELFALGLSSNVIKYIDEYRKTREIDELRQVRQSIDEWIVDLIMPGYFDNVELGRIIAKYHIQTRDDLIGYVNSHQSINKYGVENVQHYDFLVRALDWAYFPNNYRKTYTENDYFINNLKGISIRGNFHNHTNFSDGRMDIIDLISKASCYNMEYVGISDHSISANGVDELSLSEQIEQIDEIQRVQAIRIFKSIECEILDDGTLDLPNDSLQKLDYVIIGLHTHANQSRQTMEHRLIQAIESPYSNILAHPSARIFKKKPPVNVDMLKIIDACIQNNVVIEINGDPSRLDLDPKYINYALEKGAYFSLDSDTHSLNGFLNLNNAIMIAQDCGIPPERCINTFSVDRLLQVFQK